MPDSQLYILQRVVTITRYLALTGTDAATLARLLDKTDYLISLMRHGEEQPGEFEQALQNMGRLHSNFATLAEEYTMPVAV